jgi:hypothetical protein
MSALRAKADKDQRPSERPLIAKNGHPQGFSNVVKSLKLGHRMNAERIPFSQLWYEGTISTNLEII